jgi:predicted DsbA family dithiol-disulfide isomerase
MRIPVDVWSDFVCPWCYLAATSLERLGEEGKIALHWRAYELRPAGAPPLPAAYKERILSARPRLYAIAREQYGIEMDPGPFGINSRAAHIGAKYAESRGKGQPYHMAVFRAYWQHAQLIDSREVLGKIAQEIGLEVEPFLTSLDDRWLEAEVLADEEEAMAHGITGVPAMVFLRKYLISGAQPYSVLKEVAEKLEAGAPV